MTVFRPLKSRAAIRALKSADDALDAYFEQADDPTVQTTQYRYLYADVESAYDNPHLPDRYRGSRDVDRGEL